MKSTKKQIIVVFAILTMALVLSCALVACNKTDTPDAQKKEFTITFDTQGGSEVKPITIAEGATITLPRNPTKEGYIFDGWYLSDEFIEAFNATQTISSNITVYAKWIEDNGQEEPPVEKTYSITFMVDGATYNTLNISEGGVITLPENPEKKCCLFDGWYIDEDLLEQFNATQDISQDIVVYAKWSDNHTVVEDSQVPATCTTAGLTAGKHCSVCGETLQAQNEIPALGHDFSNEWTIDKEATCTENGSKSHHCTRCEVKSDVTEIPTIEHSESDWIIDKEATCTEDGSKHTECTVCQTTIKTEKISALGHTGGTATCTEQAMCSVCGEKYGDALGHKYGDIIPKTEPTCSEKGMEAHYKCSVCNKVFKDDEHKTETTLDELTIEINPNAHNFGEWIKNEGADTHTRVCSYNSEHTETESCHGGTATCIEQAVCEKCNAKYGELAKHDYKDNVCIVCGIHRLSEGLKYSLNSDGNGYTVTGIGTCTDKELIIPSEYNAKPVTSIGERAFSWCTGLTSVTIPDSVTSIGKYAFYSCTGLTSITVAKGNTKYHSADNCLIETESKTLIAGCKNSIIPTDGSVTSIGWNAFDGCTGLTSITIPDSVTSIGKDAFYNTAWYDNQPDGLVYAGKVAYTYKGTMPSNTSIVLKEGTLGIADEAFSWCTGLTSVTIPDSMTSIGYRSFYNCTGLTSVTIPDSVTSIGGETFSGCSGLTSITIPDSVTSIGYEAFYKCSGLTSVTIPDSVTSIGFWAFYNCTGLTNITIPDSVMSIGSYAFYNCTGLTNVTIGGSVTSIGESAFEGCKGLTSVTIPDSMTSIGYRAFYNCTGLTSVTIGNGVTSIGERAFYNCTGLTSVTIPDSVTSIEKDAFANSNNLQDIYITDIAAWCNVSGLYNLMYNGASNKKLYINNELATSITISDGVTAIPSYAFYNCTGLMSVTIPDSVTSIGERAFTGCSEITSISGSSDVISKVAKQASPKSFVGNITSGTSVMASAFLGMTGLKGVTIPDSVTSIGERAFDGCRGLTSVTIPDSVTSIGSNAFTSCTGLTSVTIPDSVTSIGHSAFSGCTGLTSVTIGKGVTRIGDSAFSGCTGLTNIKFNGTIEQWKAISKDYYWKYNVPATQVICTDGTVSI